MARSKSSAIAKKEFDDGLFFSPCPLASPRSTKKVKKIRARFFFRHSRHFFFLRGKKGAPCFFLFSCFGFLHGPTRPFFVPKGTPRAHNLTSSSPLSWARRGMRLEKNQRERTQHRLFFFASRERANGALCFCQGPKKKKCPIFLCLSTASTLPLSLSRDKNGSQKLTCTEKP